jgi:GAF domain-containing protein
VTLAHPMSSISCSRQRRKPFARLVRGHGLGAALDGLLVILEQLVGPNVAMGLWVLDPDRKHLRLAAGPHVPAAFRQAVDGCVIGPNVGSCGLAICQGQPVMVRDVAASPLWTEYGHFLIAGGIRGTWSIPIVSSQGNVVVRHVYPMHRRLEVGISLPDVYLRRGSDRSRHPVGGL